MPVDGVAEVILRSLDLRDLARYEAQIAEAQSLEPPVEKNPEPVERQEKLKQRQEKGKGRDQGFEM